jgi:hypothetical protein
VRRIATLGWEGVEAVAGPRFLFVCSNEGGTRARSVTTLHAAPKFHHFDHVAWRLLGANNRELGRSPIWYPDVESCREAVRALKREIGGLTSALMSVPQPGGAWSWRLAVSGTPVAVAGRPYHRQRECAYNLNHFVAAVPGALIADEPCSTGRR